VSDNHGMRWDLDGARRLLGYAPADGRPAMLTPAARARELLAHWSHRLLRH